MGTDKWFSLSRLKRAVKKVRFLLSFNLNRWRVASMIGRRSFGTPRRFSFNDRLGLRDAFDDESGSDDQEHNSDSSSRGLQRTISSPLSSDQEYDINQRAEMFITNFRRQLQMERQVSLQLRYCNRTNSSEWRSPWGLSGSYDTDSMILVGWFIFDQDDDDGVYAIIF